MFISSEDSPCSTTVHVKSRAFDGDRNDGRVGNPEPQLQQLHRASLWIESILGIRTGLHPLGKSLLRSRFLRWWLESFD